MLVVRAWPEGSSSSGVRFRMLESGGAAERETIVAVSDSTDDIADVFRAWVERAVHELGDDPG